MEKNIFDDGIIKRYIYYRKIPKSTKHPIKECRNYPTQYECTICNKWYDTQKEAEECCPEKKVEWLKFLEKGKYKDYLLSSVGAHCCTCVSYAMGRCKCPHLSFNDDCEVCY